MRLILERPLESGPSLKADLDLDCGHQLEVPPGAGPEIVLALILRHREECAEALDVSLPLDAGALSVGVPRGGPAR